ncbi:hypothetical protein SNE40_017325 [Patella caerulea]|uniref:Uncharacterized protein n=1 Tax=Patella caerulea TaxID=87958 RepID=A0AAN8JGV4_PATCE
MKLLVVYVLCFAAVTVVLSDGGGPVFSETAYEASVSCVLRDGQPIASVRANGPNAVRYSLQTGQGYENKFEIHPRSGTISSYGARNYCSNINVDFGLKAVATDKTTKMTSTVIVKVTLQPLPQQVNLPNHTSK